MVQLVKTYNNLCSQISQLIKDKKAPLGAIAPQPIGKEGLFKLDVDDDIWQDVGLDENGEGFIPRWLGDEDVRAGIKNVLELDRCQEEEVRLQKERCAMQEWMLEEWTCVDATIKLCTGKPFQDVSIFFLSKVIFTDPELVYQLQHRARYLTRLCVTWQSKVRAIGVNMPKSWGPSEEDLLEALEAERQGSWSMNESMETDEEHEDEYDDSESEDEEDGELFYASEMSALSDAYHQNSDQWPGFSSENLLLDSHVLPSTSFPMKRKHY